GVIDAVRQRVPHGFHTDGARIYLLGQTRDELDGSAWAQVIHNHLGGRPPRVDLVRERILAGVLVDAAKAGLLDSAHDISDGGLAQTLVESTLAHGVGAT